MRFTGQSSKSILTPFASYSGTTVFAKTGNRHQPLPRDRRTLHSSAHLSFSPPFPAHDQNAEALGIHGTHGCARSGYRHDVSH
ncbi:hypothetical protein CEXT_321561 [Caerostris extrusa]|uniref:Uncharacterized protein n=1 Tax=Caerostris extrusa TaxID=172846 RepID=A0AAV4MDT8_CAEEX|nr:hypothetical protein CEXT_321561 [Caerostris extrusa]